MSRIAIVHDWLTGQRGGENVLAAVLELLPEADVFALTHVPGSVDRTIEERVRGTSWLARVPVLRARPDLALPLLTRAAERLPLEGYDAVLSISHCVALGVTAPRAVHLVYSLSPMRYAWDGFDDYATSRLAKLVGSALRSRLQAWDRRAGSRESVRGLACISEFVRERVKLAYGRDARVVFPPVDTETFARAGERSEPGEAFVAVGAVRPNKRLELVVEAFRELALPLDVLGQGSPRALERLRKLGGKTVRIFGHVTKQELVERVSRSRALVHAAREDFGIAPVEALAAGRPVIAFAGSGVRESVAPPGEREAGVLYREPTSVSLVAAVRRFQALAPGELPTPDELRARAARFSLARFRENFSSFLVVQGGEPFAQALATRSTGTAVAKC